MPDSGHNGYVSVAADGTVVVPNNLTPDGLIAAGDLASHADLATGLDSLVTGYDLANVLHVGEAIGDDEGGWRAGPLRNVNFSFPAGNLTEHDEFTGPYDELAAGDTWRIAGYFNMSSGLAALGNAFTYTPGVGPDANGNFIQLQIVSLSASFALCAGDFNYQLLYHTG